MVDELVVPIRTEADIVEARQKGRALATRLGLSMTESTLVATAISEVARNILTYAVKGTIILAEESKGTRRGLVVVARDQGPGIPDIARAMKDGYSTGNGLGLGLPGAKRLMDELEIESAPGTGTTITLRKWAPRVT